MRAGALAYSAAPVLLCAFWPMAGAAQDVDQVEWLDTEKGEWELELQAIHAPWELSANPPFDGEQPRRGSLRATTEYGVTDTLQVSLELGLEHPFRSVVRLGEITPQIKWTIASPESAAVGLGVQIGAEIDPYIGKVGNESYVIVQRHFGAVAAAGNLIVSTEPGDWSNWNLAYAVRGQAPVNAKVTLGLEAGGVIAGENAGAHFLGPIVLFEPWSAQHPSLELSVFGPLGGSAPPVQIRLEIDIPF